jgi:hypothetical protein
MREIKAITHHHPVFLKEAYKYERIKLFSDDRFFRKGDRYIKFNPSTLRFCVYTHTGKMPNLAGSFDNILSAMFNT